MENIFPWDSKCLLEVLDFFIRSNGDINLLNFVKKSCINPKKMKVYLGFHHLGNVNCRLPDRAARRVNQHRLCEYFSIGPIYRDTEKMFLPGLSLVARQ